MGWRSRSVSLLKWWRWGSTFIFPFNGTSSSKDSLPLLKLLDDDESSDWLHHCCADCFDLEEGSDEPSPAEPQGDLWTFSQLETAESCAGCFDFEEGLGDLSTLLQLEPSGSFFDFGFLRLLWSVDGCNISSILTVLTLALTKVLIEVVNKRFNPFGGVLLLLLL